MIAAPYGAIKSVIPNLNMNDLLNYIKKSNQLQSTGRDKMKMT